MLFWLTQTGSDRAVRSTYKNFNYLWLDLERPADNGLEKRPVARLGRSNTDSDIDLELRKEILPGSAAHLSNDSQPISVQRKTVRIKLNDAAIQSGFGRTNRVCTGILVFRPRSPNSRYTWDRSVGGTWPRASAGVSGMC
jgi:hypothetical protein